MSAKKTGLGRGIGALIPTQQTQENRPVDVFFPAPLDDQGTLLPVPGAQLVHLDPKMISPNPVQPRKVFEQEALDELIASIREVGVLQPIVVRKHPNKETYELIMGERRLRASKELNFETIPAILKDTSDEHMLRDALLENLHRSELNPLEEASAYQQLLTDFGITQEELAQKIGRSRPQIANTIRLLKLPTDIQKKVAEGKLTPGHARAILSVGEALEMRLKFATKIIEEDLSVRQAEKEAKTFTQHISKQSSPKPGKHKDHLDALARGLGDHLNTKVNIRLGARRGQIVIDFSTVQDLNRIIEEIRSHEER